MLQNLLFHTFKGIPGFSSKKTNPVKLGVSRITYRKRLFKIIDRKYDYTLSIYQNDSPIYLMLGFVLYPIRTNSIITFRYKTEQEVLLDIEDCNKKIHIYNKNVEAFMSKELKKYPFPDFKHPSPNDRNLTN
jgi:hypothetical protein